MKFNFLTKDFFEKYKDCQEMEKKTNRPYTCATLVNCMGIIFAVPLRSHIKHEYAIFTDKNKTKGLDLSKAVVINDLSRFVDTVTKVYINDDEYKFLLGKEDFLSKKLEGYIGKYKKALKKPDISKNKNLIEHSTLQYFHKELKIELNQEKKEELKLEENPWEKLKNDRKKGLKLGK